MIPQRSAQLVIPSFKKLQEIIDSCNSSDVQMALSGQQTGIHGLAALLSPAADNFLTEMAERSREITLQRFGRVMQLYAPVYLSNFCVNQCAYCGFSVNNKISRKVLSMAEVEEETNILHARGFNHILLVTGEAPGKVGIDYLEKVAVLLRKKFAAVSIEVQPLSSEEYRRLFKAGVTAVAVYQETYDREVYDKVHLAGKKCDYDFRLETPARCAVAGMREVGIGALLGLSDWRLEVLAIGIHLAWLRKHFWRTALTVSFPRLRPAAGEFSPLVEVSERELSQMIFALRMFDPDVGLLLSTREESRYRDGMLGLGPTRMSAGSCTSPGGYSKTEQNSEQFSVGDERSLGEVCAAIRQEGLDPVRKDWDPEFQQVM
jgi:2-iminoacetate synthase